MAGTLTRGEWLVSTLTIGDRTMKKWTCQTIIGGTNDALLSHVTKPTPSSLDTARDFTLVINAAATTLVGSGTTTTSVYGGVGGSFAVGDTLTVTRGKAVATAANINGSADYDAAKGTYAWKADTHAPYPTLAFATTSDAALSDAVCVWEIYQAE
jgi:hypothetical protein